MCYSPAIKDPKTAFYILTKLLNKKQFQSVQGFIEGNKIRTANFASTVIAAGFLLKMTQITEATMCPRMFIAELCYVQGENMVWLNTEKLTGK